MKGYIVTIKDEFKNKRVQVRHMLFGKVQILKDKKYFYPGFLHTVPYRVLCPGCWFMLSRPDSDRYLNILEADIYNLTESDLKTAKDFWIKHAVNHPDARIKNLTF